MLTLMKTKVSCMIQMIKSEMRIWISLKEENLKDLPAYHCIVKAKEETQPLNLMKKWNRMKELKLMVKITTGNKNLTA